MSKQNNNPVYQNIAIQITELIETGELKSGDKLPAERTLAEKFKVSRSSVREAIKSLSQQNLVESRRGDGTYICSGTNSDIARAFTAVFADQKKRINDIFQFRKIIEPEIAALAATSIDNETLKHMKVILCDQQMLTAKGENAREMDSLFHKEIAKATGNSIFPEMMNALGELMMESRSEILQTPQRQEKSIAMHFQLLEAFEKRDPAAARNVMRQHIAEIEEAAEG